MAHAKKCLKCLEWYYGQQNATQSEPYDDNLCENCNREIRNQNPNPK